MTKTLTDLLAADAVASRYGCALKPKLRQAIEADLGFPARAASPRPEAPIAECDLPENVQSLSSHSAKTERRRA
ncbi:hypothetical protein [Ruegeria sp. EL01]|jgi:hypothetical protein|uniref:hypothetical protein n=1 Tax=Ruegeria sp. EL01 TaxID=2107578 RepID=UPI000EA82F34|nr:hypothetical protein [Ruegeria sp. EL01]